MDQRHLRRKFCQEQRLFHRRVAAAHDDDRPVAEKESVARRTGRNAVAAQALGHRSFARNAKPFGRSAGRDDQRIGLDDGRYLGRCPRFPFHKA